MAALAPAADFQFPGHRLTVPDGFEVELVAGPPLVDRPIVADFDELGRLYVADSSGSNDKVEKQLADKPHRIVRLEDADGDGRFEKSVVFADRMMFPSGAMWLDGSLYVSAPPSIWKLTDTNGDGVADERVEWFKGGTLTGCANDLHGPYAGPDGWIYWCKGAFTEQRHSVGGKPFVSRAAHVFRARPDGSRLEPVITAGMDNPIEIAFTPTGEPIVSGTFFQHPAAGQRDGLFHAVYGGVWGKSHDVLDGHIRTGELMPPLTHLGPAAPSGLTRYHSAAFGEGYRDNLFTALFNMHKVTRHVLEPEGATFKTRDTDFLVAHDADFHPTDVLEDADGSLLVLDTGGWYKLCCPTSQLSKPDVLGAIYRVRRKDAPKPEDPRGLKISWDKGTPAELTLLLDDARPAVRERAVATLAKRGEAAVPALAQLLSASGSPRGKLHGISALARIESGAAREATRSALGDKDATVQAAAAHAASVWRDAAAAPALLRLLAIQDAPQLQRVAAEALGRIGEKSAAPALLAAVRNGDRVLEHSLIFALIELGETEPLRVALGTGTLPARKAALIALDQLGGKLTVEDLRPWLFSPEAELRTTARSIAGRRPELAHAFAEELLENAAVAERPEAEVKEEAQLLSQLAAEPPVRKIFAATLASEAPAEARKHAVILRGMAQARVREMPAEWAAALAQRLTAGDVHLPAALAAIRSLPAMKEPPAELIAALQKVARDPGQPASARLDALAALPSASRALDTALFDFLRANLTTETPLIQRSAAAQLLATTRLEPAQQSQLIASLKSASGHDLVRLLGAFENSTDEALGKQIVAALKEAPGAASAGAGMIKPRLAKFPAAVQLELEGLLTTLGGNAAQQRAHLDQLTASLPAGDIRRGQELFNGPKTACSACHAIGYLGGNLGPDLTRIGQIRTERDLLESVVYPSASFVRSYEPTFVTTKAGEMHNGIAREESAAALSLAIAPGNEVRLSRSDIAESQPGTVSLMPPGYAQMLSPQELADILAFLKATRW